MHASRVPSAGPLIRPRWKKETGGVAGSSAFRRLLPLASAWEGPRAYFQPREVVPLAPRAPPSSDVTGPKMPSLWLSAGSCSGSRPCLSRRQSGHCGFSARCRLPALSGRPRKRKTSSALGDRLLILHWNEGQLVGILQ